jgi:pimeloyl-ACP methyl ester carboxylesterase
MTASTRVLGHVLHGTGSELVLVLHDWLGDSTNYDSVLSYLDRAAFTYAFADLRGYGRSRDVAGEYSVNEIARDCLALADALGWSRFHVVGHSMTGMATQRLAADAPERIKSAVAVCPVSAAGSPIDAAARAFFASTTTDDAALLRLAGFVSPGLSPGFAANKLRQNRERVAAECRLGYLAMLTETDFIADMSGLATPFLVLIGDRDPGLDAAAMAKTFLAWHLNAELKTFASCGHYPMQECPPAFVAAVEEFLRRHAG